LGQENPARLLEPDALLELERAHGGHRSKMAMERGRAHPCDLGQFFHADRLLVTASDRMDRAADPRQLGDPSCRPLRKQPPRRPCPTRGFSSLAQQPAESFPDQRRCCPQTSEQQWARGSIGEAKFGINMRILRRAVCGLILCVLHRPGNAMFANNYPDLVQVPAWRRSSS
jgi:hypothetical protein